MKPFSCVCGNMLFFDNTVCLSCGREVGWCPACAAVRALEPAGDGLYRCTAPSCGHLLVKCANYAREGVCNRCVDAGEGHPGLEPLCDCCRFNATIPDLSVTGNRERWARIEAAKRRLIYVLDLLGLPYGGAADGFEPPLSFDFKGDVVPAGAWRPVVDEERVYTGHQDGRITINIREADDLEREKLRVDLGEAHRTLVGHFRHEIGHYYWDLLIRGRREDDFRRLFGDHDNPPYTEALERHYRDGPPADWALRFISSYASMHPWEDWAETFAFYLDIVSVLETASHMGVGRAVSFDDLQPMLGTFAAVGVAANEMNRTMGLTDLVPELITPPVAEKLGFVHETVRSAHA
ncbi:MAG: putative zinc-binding metallopeptidase [Acetobacterales bacterium]